MTLQEFLSLCLNETSKWSMGTDAKRPPGEMRRTGQTIMNQLSEHRPDLYASIAPRIILPSFKIVSHPADAFYSEEKVPALLEWLGDNW